LPTEVCCFGHDLEQELFVGFSRFVEDNDIMNMISYLNDRILVDFKKWVRTGKEGILINW
jgi:hypothetical protein